MCWCVSWHRPRPAGTESAAGRPAEWGKWRGVAAARCLTGGQTVGGDDHTLGAIITPGGGCRLGRRCCSDGDYPTARPPLGSDISGILWVSRLIIDKSVNHLKALKPFLSQFYRCANGSIMKTQCSATLTLNFQAFELQKYENLMLFLCLILIQMKYIRVLCCCFDKTKPNQHFFKCHLGLWRNWDWY